MLRSTLHGYDANETAMEHQHAEVYSMSNHELDPTGDRQLGRTLEGIEAD